MVNGVLLHNASNVRIGGSSGQRKLGLRGRVLQWHHFGEEVFFILKSLLGRGGPLQRFLATPQEISQRPQNAGTTRKKTAVKVHHAK
jgi:hypothetical protein